MPDFRVLASFEMTSEGVLCRQDWIDDDQLANRLSEEPEQASQLLDDELR